MIRAPLDDLVGRAAYFVGDLDPKVSRLCRRIVRPGDTVLDIGANIGVVTFALARRVGPGGHVHSFEPNPRLAGLLRESAPRNASANVTVHELALGPEETTATLLVPASNAGKGSLVRQGHDPTSRPVQVPVRRLSDVLADLGRPRVRLVKIDVEGFEENVLRGAADAFADQPPDAIVFELDTDVTPQHPVFRLLGELGYAVRPVLRSLVRSRLGRDLGELDGCNDFLAVHRDADVSI